jgi:anti-sigma factor RsiW
MKCDEVQSLLGPYLDSELDTRTTVEVGQHLKACAACTRVFAEEEKLESQLRASLNQGTRTPALWAQIERQVAAVASPASLLRVSAPSSLTVGWRASLIALRAQLRAGWRAAQWAWAGLAAVWAVILVLNGSAREPGASVLSANRLPPIAEVRLAVEQKYLLMADLAFLAEPAPAGQPQAAPPGPRSDRRRETSNS